MECISSFPINIQTVNQKGNCSLGCKLECNYHNSTCSATNKGTYLHLSYDKVPLPPVKFNDTDLDVKEIRIYSPSLHLYEGNHEDAEMVILHHGNDEHMAICVPIKINDDSTDNILNEIIETCSSLIPNTDEKTSLSLTDYNLTHFVPFDSPFLHYTCNIPFDCSVVYNACVFGNKKQYIPVSSTALFTLQTIIGEHGIKPYTHKMEYFMNPNGITKKLGNTYVRCFKKKDMPDELRLLQASSVSSAEDISDIEATNNDTNVEGFTNMDLWIEDKYSIHVGVVAAVLLGVGYLGSKLLFSSRKSK